MKKIITKAEVHTAHNAVVRDKCSVLTMYEMLNTAKTLKNTPSI
jgi:hypothetical protein